MIVDDDGKVIEKMSLSDLMTYLNLRPCDENSAKAEGSSISLRDQDSINTMQESVAAQSETSVSADNNDSCRINGREILFVILYLFILLFFSYIFFYFLHF
ncbi:hypothetical protein PV328_000450 [Microctonus aethiopoides]|uniref:Uncharacterized protein n=1 Tax=Microctonus aethiopoides TaxID=144406 RepID=A0AA39KWA8_9HYME|nr:hypothetical protein PV328_000450 [Microctonus aethiopoides]